LDCFEEMYNITLRQFRKNHNLDIVNNIFAILRPRLPENICELMTNKVYISYYDLKRNKKIVKKKWDNVDEIFETIYKSCFFPILINGNIFYKERYVDGIFPFIFKKRANRRILFLDLFGYDKITHIVNVKNEKVFDHRILNGMLDIHSFFIKETSTSMCSYVDEWTLNRRIYFRIRSVMEYFFVMVLRFIFYFFTGKSVFEGGVFKLCYLIVSRILYDIYVILLEHYCL
jgi:hypothetical protein